MKTSEKIENIAAALADAQTTIETAPKDKENPFFKSWYADLNSCWEACRPSLARNHLAVIQSPSVTPERFVRITTRIIHKSGEWIEGDLDLKPQQDTPQAIGSAITYGKRYALSAMLGVVADEDDDGNATNAIISRAKFDEIMRYADSVDATADLMKAFKEKTNRDLSNAFTNELPFIKQLVQRFKKVK